MTRTLFRFASATLAAAPLFLFAAGASAQEPAPGPAPAPAPAPPPGGLNQNYAQPQPGYGQGAPAGNAYGQPAPGYGQPGPGYGQPAAGYGPPPPPAYYGPPPQAQAQIADPPPPPRRTEDQWNIRWNPLDIIFGRGTAAVEYLVAGPLTIGVQPTYVFGKPVYDSGTYDVSGWAMAGQVGVWVDGRAFRGFGLKFHAEHESARYSVTDVNGKQVDTDLSMNKLGGLLVSQSVHGGWFTFSTGIGVVKDVSWKEEEHKVTCPGGTPGLDVCDIGSGLGRGWDILGELAIGALF